MYGNKFNNLKRKQKREKIDASWLHIFYKKLVYKKLLSAGTFACCVFHPKPVRTLLSNPVHREIHVDTKLSRTLDRQHRQLFHSGLELNSFTNLACK